MKNVLFAWLGLTDLNASNGDKRAGIGPIAQALKAKKFDDLVLISDHSEKVNKAYIKWLSSKTKARVLVKKVKLSSPIHFGDIYESAVKVIEEVKKKFGSEPKYFFHLSPGTPAMASIWIILSKTRYPAQLIQTSPEKGFQLTTIPFEISADYLPDLLKSSDEKLERLAGGLLIDAPEFDSIIHRCELMKTLITKAKKVAPRSVPVLILGESGTGKELMAEAIHNSSLKKNGPFKALNCGAIPQELLEAELFGYEKSAFTDAKVAKKGYIEESSGGTLFLDEIGDLPLNAQVKLLRVLNDHKVIRVGSTTGIPVDLRVIAATNKDLAAEVSDEKFREDLFHRIAVAILNIPPIRERKEDLNLLTDFILDRINKEYADQPGFKAQTISVSARNFINQYHWSGNFRELENTLSRVAIWSSGTVITEDDIEEALIRFPKKDDIGILGRPLGNGFKLQAVLDDVTRHYLKLGMKESGGNKSKAAKILGLPNYQTYTNWLEKYEVD